MNRQIWQTRDALLSFCHLVTFTRCSSSSNPFNYVQWTFIRNCFNASCGYALCKFPRLSAALIRLATGSTRLTSWLMPIGVLLAGIGLAFVGVVQKNGIPTILTKLLLVELESLHFIRKHHVMPIMSQVKKRACMSFFLWWTCRICMGTSYKPQL